MSASERVNARDGAQTFDDVIVVGGGCYGSYYVRQLQRAVAARAMCVHRIVVVDRDADCQVAQLAAGARREPWPVSVEVVRSDWAAFFDEYLSAAADAESRGADAIVPSPLMPHLMAEWLIARARRRWPARGVFVAPLDEVPDVPWTRAGGDGTQYVSFATWTCPVNCIEPHTCPHTRGERTWSLPETLAAYTREPRSAGRPRASVVLHCAHRAYGVGMFDTAAVVAGDRIISTAARHGPVDVLIGTVSHCHGALTRLVIPADGERGDSVDR